MLNIMLDEDTDPLILSLLTDFRRAQVSRFPINVDTNAGVRLSVRFSDSRFPPRNYNTIHALALLSLDGLDKNMKPLLKITSKRITNDKYSSHNSEYRTRTSSDPKKMLKWMKDYIKPYTPAEVAEKTFDRMQDSQRAWRIKAEDAVAIHGRLSEDDLYTEVEALANLGVQFHTEKFRQLLVTGLPAYHEKKVRRNTPEPNTHVSINPDHSIVVTANEEFTAYDSFDALPQNIQQQVSFLRMVEPNEYVPTVGIGFDQNAYWIHVEPQK